MALPSAPATAEPVHDQQLGSTPLDARRNPPHESGSAERLVHFASGGAAGAASLQLQSPTYAGVSERATAPDWTAHSSLHLRQSSAASDDRGSIVISSISDLGELASTAISSASEDTESCLHEVSLAQRSMACACSTGQCGTVHSTAKQSKA